VINSRLFPFRFFTAFQAIEVNLEELQKLATDPSYLPDPTDNPASRRSGIMGGRGRGRGRPARGAEHKPTILGSRPIKVLRPKHVPDQALLDSYDEAIENAIQIATTHNIKPV
jgi:hypothetical protein